MKRIVILAIAATLAAGPVFAQAPPPFRDRGHHGPQHGQPRYPKNWGPHRAPDGRGYYRGYRGFHDQRRGYRRGPDGMWYPAAAFAVGALIGGALGR